MFCWLKKQRSKTSYIEDRDIKTQLSAHAGAEMAVPAAQPRPGQVRTPGALTVITPTARGARRWAEPQSDVHTQVTVDDRVPDIA